MKLTCTFQVSLDFEGILSVVLDAVRQSSICVALVLAGLVVVVLTIAVAALANSLASRLLFSELGLGVGIDEVIHADNVLSAVGAAGARAAGAKSEANKVLLVEQAAILVVVATAFTAYLDETGASQVLDGVLVEGSALLVILFQRTGVLNNCRLVEQRLADLGVDRNITVRSEHGIGRGANEHREEGSSNKLHGGNQKNSSNLWQAINCEEMQTTPLTIPPTSNVRNVIA
jgi:hypothetical protein